MSEGWREGGRVATRPLVHSPGEEVLKRGNLKADHLFKKQVVQIQFVGSGRMGNWGEAVGDINVWYTGTDKWEPHT